jgi:hypothetical protein
MPFSFYHLIQVKCLKSRKITSNRRSLQTSTSVRNMLMLYTNHDRAYIQEITEELRVTIYPAIRMCEKT